ncbi:hypothetical protein NHX12_033007 [Muraenolepis orangiensis]|uniref:Tetraspanin n=1 Tax=Muraenolepis orangiensis TaxID=630683 RepID=A0A9Q0E0U6_9TELE|nr:hypothetical protein NHX12_033007 [Muraenolepis orangiensis]
MGCFTFVKVMMVLFNMLIFLGGISLLALGIWATVDGSSFLQILGTFSSQAMQFVNVGFFCIAVGVLLMLLGLMGFIAAHRESRCLLLMFFSIILIIFVAEVAAVVVALAYSSFEQYGSDPVVTKIWNTTMTELNCCGFTNYTDFGCFVQLLEMLKMNTNIVGGVAAGIGAVEIAAMVVSMYLYCSLDSREPLVKH